MKTISAALGLLILSGVATFAQPKGRPAVNSDFAVSERGPHHKVWQRIEQRPAPDGTMVDYLRSYEELATGLHFRNARGEWEDSREEIEILPSNAGAIASRGQHRAIFPPEIKSGLIELQMPNGQWLRSRVWGLAYFDSSSGASVLLAEVKSSDGQVVGDNVVVYPDAFTDNILADLRFTYTRSGFEQDVVIRTQIPDPESFGLIRSSTKLQVLTEFVEVSQPTKTSRQAGDLPDQSLVFGQGDGQMTIGAGKAFSVDVEGDATGHVPVAKGFERLDEAGGESGRDFLIEEVRYEQVAEQLQRLPEAKPYKGASLQRRGTGKNVIAGLKQVMPKRYAKAAPQAHGKSRAQYLTQFCHGLSDHAFQPNQLHVQRRYDVLCQWPGDS
jgi:hypothetical protein